ncbi:MAG: hypothetical protein K8R99_14970 [Actinomycetia bacterium]|nr:hypothetical protein [Actinomycetes bacterium]
MTDDASTDLLSRSLDRWEQDLRKAHTQNVATARTDSQKAGHAAEGIWVKVIERILPPGYRVLTRKYMGTEVDIVILPPSAPRFYDDAEVTDIPPAIASAVIHVKNTLNKKELRDAMERVHVANKDQRHYRATEAREREGLPSAIVALGSEWAGEFNSAVTAFLNILQTELPPSHPSQIPSFVGTPDWDMHNLTIDMWPVPGHLRAPHEVYDERWEVAHIVKLIDVKPSGKPIHSFAQWLYTSCVASDLTLEPMRVALVQQFNLAGEGLPWRFDRSAVYSDATLQGGLLRQR